MRSRIGRGETGKQLLGRVCCFSMKAEIPSGAGRTAMLKLSIAPPGITGRSDERMALVIDTGGLFHSLKVRL